MDHSNSTKATKADANNLIKTRQAYEYIRSGILNGTYGPGDRIVIDRIAAELNISISPVREVIRQLEADGFVQMTPYSGAVVRMVNLSEFEETYMVLVYLEAGATALASSYLNEQDIHELKTINNEMREALHVLDYDRFNALNRKFHDKIFERCCNEYLQEQIQRVLQRLALMRRSIFTLVPFRAKHSIDEHDRLILMFKEKASAKKIEEFARKHKLRSLKGFKRAALKRKKRSGNGLV